MYTCFTASALCLLSALPSPQERLAKCDSHASALTGETNPRAVPRADRGSWGDALGTQV